MPDPYKDKLIAEIKKEGLLKNPLVLRAFKEVDREDFVPEEYESEAYGNYPLPIGFGQTISQPFTVAFMLNLLEIQQGEIIMDVGAGSGWVTTMLASAVGPKGRVFGVEIIPEILAFGQRNISKYKFKNASMRQAGKELGLPEEAPYDKILVSAAGRTYPKELMSQLKVGGILVMPIKYSIWKIKKTGAPEPEIEKFGGFAFVPLIESLE